MHQIEDHLVDLVTVCADQGNIAPQFHPHSDILSGRQVVDHLQYGGDDLVEIGIHAQNSDWREKSNKRRTTARERWASLSTRLISSYSGDPFRERFQEQFSKPCHCGKRIIQFMGNCGRHLTNSGQFGRPHQALFGQSLGFHAKFQFLVQAGIANENRQSEGPEVPGCGYRCWVNSLAGRSSCTTRVPIVSPCNLSGTPATVVNGALKVFSCGRARN